MEGTGQAEEARVHRRRRMMLGPVVAASLIIAAVPGRGAAQPAAAKPVVEGDLGSYALFAVDSLRTKGFLALDAGNLGVNGGALRLNGRFDGASSEVAARTVRVAPPSRCARLFANQVVGTGAGCPPSNVPVVPLHGPIVADGRARGPGHPGPRRRAG